MEFNAVYHQASDNYCYPLNEDELIINIKTGYDVKRVNIILNWRQTKNAGFTLKMVLSAVNRCSWRDEAGSVLYFRG